MSENERVHFKIAIPVDLKKRLEHHAVDERRSLSAEIIHRLTVSVEADEWNEATESVKSDPSSLELTPDQERLLVKLLDKLAEKDLT